MALARDKAIVSEQQGQERIGIEQQNANTAAARAAQTAFNENRNYGVALSRLGIENKRLQLEALKSEAKKQGGGFTPYEIHGLTKDAGQVIEQGKQNGYTRAQVLNNLAANGIPLSIAAPLLKRFGYAPVNLGSPAAGNGKSMFANLGSLFKQEGGGGPFAAAGNATETVAARTIVGLAHEYIGTPYVYGGESPKGFDCSGLAQYLYGKAGIRVPRTSEEQYAGGMPVPNNQLQPGDLLFFVGSDGTRSAPGHEGIYIGNGHFIEAPHTGASVRVSALAGYPGYVGARRYGKG
jgi:cell wall-associated NlpC family hydrolase